MDVNLIMFKENGQRKDFPLKGKACVVGRRDDCDLRIPLPAISRRHCKFLRGENGVELKDLASSNGTFVNNQRVQETILKAGDRVVVGPVVFIIQIDGDPADPKPVRTRLTKAAPPPKAGVVTPDRVAARPAARPAAALPPQPLELGMPAGEELDPIAALEALAGAVNAEDPTIDVEPVVEPKKNPKQKNK
ncbi:MAG: FHA domain-containing protein [Phycisphaerae bacterium]|nr:FHA domain-containing protein [Phycisphaerae bacterium]